MAASIPLPALHLNPPPDPNEGMMRAASLFGLLQQSQMRQQYGQLLQQDTQARQLQNQQMQRAMQDNDTIRRLAPQFVQRDDSGKLTGFDSDGYFNRLMAEGVDPATVAQYRDHYAQGTEAVAHGGSAVLNLENQKNDRAYQILEGMRDFAKQPNVDPQTVQDTYQDSVGKLQQLGIDTSKYPQNFAQVGDRGLTQFEVGLGVHKQMLADAKAGAATSASNARSAMNMAAKGMKPDPDNPGSFVPMDPSEYPPALRSTIERNDAAIDLANARAAFQQARAAGEPVRIQQAQARLNQAQQNYQVRSSEFERDTFGTVQGQPVPGGAVDQAGNPVGSTSPLARQQLNPRPPQRIMQKPPQGFTRILDSQGGVHDIPTPNLNKARQRDPGLQVLQ